MRILLVEDDISLCKALMIHLNSQGYETDVCHNGTDGLSYALQNTYDVMILSLIHISEPTRHAQI